ncbi:MAG: PLP-dependent aminotransferase family protein [Defluviitaleaceae bacterium]|nr:PLP-dependent aminotransferase family protein [Defluviitaleaceae bacterium]
MTVDKTSETPLYKQLGDALLEKIKSGEILPRERLPAIRTLAASLCVNNTTVVAAYKYLERQNAAYSIRGSGTFAAVPPGEAAGSGLSGISDDCINFLSGATDPALFPADDFRYAFDAVLSRDGANAFSFPGHGGYAPLRETLCEMYGKNIHVAQNINQGLENLADVLLSPGDAVVIETPSAPERAAFFVSRGVKVLEVPVNESGIDVEKFSFFVKKFKPKVFFLTPNYQIPTTLCYTETEKVQILELAYNSKAYIIEEDTQNDFFYAQSPVSLRDMDERNRVICLKSFDRVLAPGLASFAACPDEIINRGFGEASGYIQRGLGFYLKNCNFAGHLEMLRKEYGRRYNKAVSAAEKFLAPYAGFQKPGGGLGLCFNGLDIADEILARKVLVAPGALFSSDFSKVKPFFRINFANVTEDEISRGIGIIASVAGRCR